MLHEAAFRGLLDVRGVERAISIHRNRRSNPTLVRAFELHRAGSAGTRSRLEDRFLRLLFAAGLPEPDVNIDVPVLDGAVRVDFSWRAARMCVELDAPGHDRPANRVDDPRRDERLRAAGFEVLRVPDDWMEHGVERIRELLDHAGQLRFMDV